MLRTTYPTEDGPRTSSFPEKLHVLGNVMDRDRAAAYIETLAAAPGDIQYPQHIASAMNRIAGNADVDPVERLSLLIEGVKTGEIDQNSRYLRSLGSAANTLIHHHVELGQIGHWENMPENSDDDWLLAELKSWPEGHPLPDEHEQAWGDVSKRNVRLFGRLIGVVSGAHRGYITEGLQELAEIEARQRMAK